MPVVLLDTDHNVIAAAVGVSGFADCQIDCFALSMAVADDLALLVNHIPAALGFIVIDMKGVVGTSLDCWFGHDQRLLDAFTQPFPTPWVPMPLGTNQLSVRIGLSDR
ncbi:MAG: hypothetical protein H0U98_04875 [Alphaproteobacteria bacterium]|nr:hypothetical protein [Alphaproteobacteria bacterium]